jgi:hypothetical protein
MARKRKNGDNRKRRKDKFVLDEASSAVLAENRVSTPAVMLAAAPAVPRVFSILFHHPEVSVVPPFSATLR